MFHTSSKNQITHLTVLSLKNILERISTLGLKPDMPAYTYRKGYSFNQMNFAGLLAAILRLSYICCFSTQRYTTSVILINALPLFATIIMTTLMLVRKHRTTVFFSFLVFPSLLFAIGISTPDRGIMAYFIAYFIYPFFFLNNIKKILFSFCLSTFFFVASISKIFLASSEMVKTFDPGLEMISIIGALILVFITLFSIKIQVWKYEKKIREQKTSLREMNQDISTQKESLQRSNLTKDKLFSIISHDLRMPIQSLVLLYSNHDDPRQTLDYIAENLPQVREDLSQTSELLNNLLKWSQLQMCNGKLFKECVDVNELSARIKRSLRQRALEKEINIRTAISFSPSLNADKSVLEVVLRNLVSNAIKFTDTGGTVEISGCQMKDSYIIQVADNGVGITAENLVRIMGQEFYTSLGTGKEKGSGMGLMICRDLVEQCKGSLTIDSVRGKGTTISIRLPNAQPFVQAATVSHLTACLATG